VGKPSNSKRPKKPARPPERQNRERDRADAGASRAEADEREVEFLPPLKPRPKVLIVLSAVFALWLAALLVMRFTTVAGHGQEQHPHDEPAQRQPVEGTVPRSP
jgi:hypothetical protein